MMGTAPTPMGSSIFWFTGVPRTEIDWGPTIVKEAVIVEGTIPAMEKSIKEVENS